MTNAVSVAMIATKMELASIRLDTLIAAVSQDLREMVGSVMVKLIKGKEMCIAGQHKAWARVHAAFLMTFMIEMGGV